MKHKAPVKKVDENMEPSTSITREERECNRKWNC